MTMWPHDEDLAGYESACPECNLGTKWLWTVDSSTKPLMHWSLYINKKQPSTGHHAMIICCDWGPSITTLSKCKAANLTCHITRYTHSHTQWISLVSDRECMTCKPNTPLAANAAIEAQARAAPPCYYSNENRNKWIIGHFISSFAILAAFVVGIQDVPCLMGP